MNLSTPVEKISGIGPVSKNKLKRLGIKTIEDLIFYFPRRYEDFSHLVKISEIRINEICTIRGKILEIENNQSWKKKMILTRAIIEDESGAIEAVWFQQPYLIKTLKKGDYLYLSGKTILKKNKIYLSNPVYEKINLEKLNHNQGNETEIILTHTGRLVPIYPETKNISSKWFRSILKIVLPKIKEKIPETLPKKILEETNLLSRPEAVWQIHFPDSKEMAEKAKERFSFEDLFYIELFILQERAQLSQEKAVAFPIKTEIIKDFVNSLPFKLTNGQKKAAWKILKDMEKGKPMNRLLEGDVGSGKTVVAVTAALNVIKSNWQVAFMAPTEILAKQHFKEVANLLTDFGANIGLLTGKQDLLRSKKLKNETIEISREKLLEKTLKGEIDILIGTHALIRDKVKFNKLGLVILDEQHRFGVEQRAKLIQPSKTNSSDNKRIIPHLLSMTATPIPRTLALTIYGDLDISLIDEMPKGRKRIITKIVKPEERKKVYEFIKKEVKKGRQVFVICPRIEKNEEVEEENNNIKRKIKSVEEEYEKLTKDIFPDLRIGILHGKMKPKEKEKVMENFKNKKIDILVSTSVVEVGIDVPNATVMIIEGAERFGLAQLHQFRGRVGRSSSQSYCFLFTNSPSKKTWQRLKALISSENGFDLAEKDLKIRGPGDFAGVKQWGMPDLIMDSLMNTRLVEKAREAAKKILINSPHLKKYPYLKAKVEKLRKKIHLE